jgi:pyruvate-formate lyase
MGLSRHLEVRSLIDRTQELTHSVTQKRLGISTSVNSPHWYYLEGFATAIDEPFEIREAKARLNFYQNVPIHILPGEAIVGLLDWNEPFVSLVSNTHIQEDVAEVIFKSDLAELDQQKLREWLTLVCPYCFDPIPHLTEEEKLVHNSYLAPSTFFNGHIVPDYGYVLYRGLGGIQEDIERFRKRQLTDVEKNFYDAMRITVQGLSNHIVRYADLAESLLQENCPGYDPDQLRHIAETCRHLAWDPAQTFPQSLQMMWFLLGFVDYDSIGRFDQYMLPYYTYSRNQGMKDEEALLWMAYTWIKLEESGAILNMTIGGRKPDGSSAVNPLTYLAMQVTRQVRFRSPNLSLRISASIPDEIWEEARLTLSTGQGLPALYNDDLIIPMLISMGYPENEARDYGMAGCSQVILPGRCNFACDVGCYNLLKALELTLHDGFDILLMQQVSPHTGTAASLDTYWALTQAYQHQMRFMTRVGVSINDKDMFLRQGEGACVRSLLTMDCLERGKGIFHGGARFYNIQNEACGITNTANALYAIKKLVYEEKKLSLENLIKILDRNWDGHEKLRHAFLRQAKFGNDQVEVDAIRSQISADWYHEIQQYPAVLGGAHLPGEVVFIYHEWHGAYTAASADGRKCGEPLASSAGASTGTDVSGPTALVNSMLKIPQEQCRTCCILNLRFSKKTWTESTTEVKELLRTYFSGGGSQVQVNLVDREDLIAARAHPEQYADLVVRVGGFSDYYVRLSERLQEEILARTEHEI